MGDMEGKLLKGKYKILHKIGKGGMATVYLAYDESINKQWAVKQVNKECKIGEEAAINILAAEASLMTRLDHPALPRIVEIIEDEQEFFLVMDFIEGKPLINEIKKGPLRQEEVVNWAIQLCDVLSYLHNQTPPIIYRDMKPDNIMLLPERDSVKLIDFGIARTYKEGRSKDTKPLGTDGYASPEQYGELSQSDQRTDIYSLGVTLYYLLTGHDPQIVPFFMKPIRQHNPKLSEGLEKIIIRCTQADPNDRYQTVEELLYDLINYQKLEEGFIKEKKKIIKKMAIPFILGIVFFITGISLAITDSVQINNSYEYLISNTQDSNQYIKNLKEAITLKPTESTAYILLIEEYAEIGFTEEKAADILSIVNTNKKNFNKKSEDYLELNFKIGENFLIYYQGKTDDSLRNKILTASPYFREVVENGNENYRNYELAKTYVNLADFYKKYILSNTGLIVNEASYEEYEKVLSDCLNFIEELKNVKSTNVDNLKLETYKIIINLIDIKRSDMAMQKISKDKILMVLDKIDEAVIDIDAHGDVTSKNRIIVLDAVKKTKNNVHQTYLNYKKEVAKEDA